MGKNNAKNSHSEGGNNAGSKQSPKIENIDAIVKAKLGQSKEIEQKATPSIDPELMEFMTPEERALFQ